jgi:hypothetical protein
MGRRAKSEEKLKAESSKGRSDAGRLSSSWSEIRHGLDIQENCRKIRNIR